MLPPFLIQALFGFSAACFVICITVFHYFRDKVDANELVNMRALFSSSETDDLMEALKDGSLPTSVTTDFRRQIERIGKPRRRLRALFLLLPLAGGLFMSSAILASIAIMETEFSAFISDVLGFATKSTLLVAFIVVVYCSYELIKLPRELT